MRTGLFKNLDDFRATPVGRETQRSPTVFVHRVHVGSRFNQNPPAQRHKSCTACA